jgi:hypothetical protein
MSVILTTWEVEAGGLWFKASPGNVSKNLSQKQKKNKRAGDMDQVVELLLIKREALGSIPSTSKNKINKMTDKKLKEEDASIA